MGDPSLTYLCSWVVLLLNDAVFRRALMDDVLGGIWVVTSVIFSAFFAAVSASFPLIPA